jgi:hypothetical protein
MKPTALNAFLAVLALSIAAPASAWSQWSVSLGLESDRYWGASLEVENSPEQKSFRPYRPTVFAAGVERRTGSIGLGVRARYAKAALGLEGTEAVVAAKGGFTVVGLAPEVSYRVATLGSGNRLLVHLGPLFEFWHPVDEEWRTRVGVQGAVSLTVPLGGRFGLSVGGNLAVTSSPFQADELLDQYELRASWRRGFVGGLQYEL